jgi:hypothetical protein
MAVKTRSQGNRLNRELRQNLSLSQLRSGPSQKKKNKRNELIGETQPFSDSGFISVQEGGGPIQINKEGLQFLDNQDRFNAQLALQTAQLNEAITLRKSTAAAAAAELDLLNRDRDERLAKNANAKLRAKNRKSKRLALIETGPGGVLESASTGRSKLLGN